MTGKPGSETEKGRATFGDLLLELRLRYGRRNGLKRGLSQGRLGDQIVLKDGKTVGKNLISLWETGQTIPPIDDSGIIITCIVQALDCSKEETKLLIDAYVAEVKSRGGLDHIL